MRSLVQEKEMAITLRKQGHTYKEILAVVPVAKSSLSLWLKDLPLTKAEKNILKHRTDSNISRGRIKAAAVNHLNRLKREREKIPAIKETFRINIKEPLFQLGIGLYWAEGAKNSGGVMFTNSDSGMVNVMLLWFETYAHIPRTELRYRLYIHKPYAHQNCEAWWAKQLQVSLSNFTPTSYKPTNLGVKKRENYMGCLRVEVPKSGDLLFKLKIWTKQLVEYHVKE